MSDRPQTPAAPSDKYGWNPAHKIGTCGQCGGEMHYNVPRLGPDGGYVHVANSSIECPRATDSMTANNTTTPAGDFPLANTVPAPACYTYATAPKTPHRCPICEGHGLVAGGFYSVVAGQESWSSSTGAEKCRACDGQGILWS